MGTTGEMGATGEMGTTGEMGATGEKGDTGENGDNGDVRGCHFWGCGRPGRRRWGWGAPSSLAALVGH
eukprot:3503701-Prorocentrum_lima.AAC.1